MLTEKCKVIIDEAITAGGDLSKLSPEAAAHIGTCIECRRSLDSIKALKASSASVIPAAGLALKAKISSKLAGALQARQAASALSTIAKTSLKAGTLVIFLGLTGALTMSVLLSNNMSEVAENSSLKGNIQNSQSLASESIDIDSATSSVKLINDGTVSDKLLKNSGSNENMRSNEPIKYPTQTVPSSKKDSDI